MPPEWPISRPQRAKSYAIPALKIVLILFAGLTARLFVWPDLPEAPPRVDAIIELGGLTDRDDAALALAREHKAPVLVQSTVPEEAGSHRCLPPVAGVTVLCFHPDPNTTRGEAQSVGRMAERYHWRSIIIVTTRDHAWRARLRVARCFPGAIYVSATSLPLSYWLLAIPYQWAATAKAVLLEREC